MARNHPHRKTATPAAPPKDITFGVVLTFYSASTFEELQSFWAEKFEGLELVVVGENAYRTMVDVSAVDETDAKQKAWTVLVEHFDCTPIEAVIATSNKQPVSPPPQGETENP